MCPPNLKRSNSSYDNNYDEDSRRKYFKFDDLTNRQTQPRVFTRFRKEEYNGHGKLSRSHHHYGKRQQEEQGRRNKRVRCSVCKNNQEEDYSSVKHQQQTSPCEIRDIKPSEKGKGNWGLACALAYLHLFGDFVAANKASDCNSVSSSSPSSSSSSSSSSLSQKSSVNHNQNLDDSVNFVLYLLTGTSTPIECLGKAASEERFSVPDVVNPTQAAHNWLSASRRITDSRSS